MSEHIAISKQALQEGLGYAIEQFAGDEGREINDQSARLAMHGDVQAFYAPAVRLTIDATLRVMRNPEVASRLSPEIAARRSSSTFVAEHFATRCTEGGIYAALYGGTPLATAAETLSLNDVESLLYPTYMVSLASAPFYDVQKVSGGAHNVLRKAGIPAAERTAIIARSTGLLAISGVSKAYGDTADRYLQWPYVHQRHLELHNGKAATVSFTKTAQQRLHNWSLPDGGCPAGRMNTGGKMLLQNYWEQMVELLVPEDATANTTPS